MAVFQYLVLSGKHPEEIIEIEQEITAPPLTKHPLTKEPISRVITSPSLTLRHSNANDKSILSEENLQKNGFSLYHKDESDGSFEKKTGRGPNSIHPGKQ